MRILITARAGSIGSNLAVSRAEQPGREGAAFDSPCRRGNELCADRTGSRSELKPDPKTRRADVPYRVAGNTLVCKVTGWAPTRPVDTILDDVREWLQQHRAELQPLLEQHVSPGSRA
jgi:hypothetical protein